MRFCPLLATEGIGCLLCAGHIRRSYRCFLRVGHIRSDLRRGYILGHCSCPCWCHRGCSWRNYEVKDAEQKKVKKEPHIKINILQQVNAGCGSEKIFPIHPDKPFQPSQATASHLRSCKLQSPQSTLTHRILRTHCSRSTATSTLPPMKLDSFCTNYCIVLPRHACELG